MPVHLIKEVKASGGSSGVKYVHLPFETRQQYGIDHHDGEYHCYIKRLLNEAGNEIVDINEKVTWESSGDEDIIAIPSEFSQKIGLRMNTYLEFALHKIKRDTDQDPIEVYSNQWIEEFDVEPSNRLSQSELTPEAFSQDKLSHQGVDDFVDKREYTGEAREILEQITSDVLHELGYESKTNVHKANREGGRAEIDVWAEKPQANFSVYVSCKNWNTDVGRPTIDQEIGRIMNLERIPQLRILVAKSFKDQAEKAAQANGFVLLQIGEQAEQENFDKIKRYIRQQLREISLALAPPEVEKLSSRASELSDELSELAEDIGNLGATN